MGVLDKLNLPLRAVRQQFARIIPLPKAAGESREGRVVEREDHLMNDPHVVALIYRVEGGPHVSFENAAPLRHEEPGFCASIEDGMARFEMKDHYANSEAARAAVDPFIRAWEMTAGLGRFRPGGFVLAYEDCEVIDRNPVPGDSSAAVKMLATASLNAVALLLPGEYPPPPGNLAVTDEVDLMYYRYSRFCSDRDSLPAIANLCLTVIEQGVQRSAAAKKYGIEARVLTTLGSLAANKGGREARKADGMQTDLTAEERDWMIEATKALIFRAAEAARTQDGPLRTIEMKDLPPL